MPLLFSYGTLQQEAVQLSTLGRRVESFPDELVGFETTVFTVTDPAFVAASGKTNHAIVKRSGNPSSRVPGRVLDLTDDEIAKSDRYEPDGYTRVSAKTASGKVVWVYADARAKPPGSAE